MQCRYCLDLLGHHSPFVRAEPGKHCTLRFGELHNPESELMCFIAAEDEREEAAANSRPTATATAVQEAAPSSVASSTAPETDSCRSESLNPEPTLTSAVEVPPTPACSESKRDARRF